jgi:hypothetical protein
MRCLCRLLCFLVLASTLVPHQVFSQTQSPSQPIAASAATSQAKLKRGNASCTSNGTYVNSKGSDGSKAGELFRAANGSHGTVPGWNLQL